MSIISVQMVLKAWGWDKIILAVTSVGRGESLRNDIWCGGLGGLKWSSQRGRRKMSVVSANWKKSCLKER